MDKSGGLPAWVAWIGCLFGHHQMRYLGSKRPWFIFIQCQCCLTLEFRGFFSEYLGVSVLPAVAAAEAAWKRLSLSTEEAAARLAAINDAFPKADELAMAIADRAERKAKLPIRWL